MYGTERRGLPSIFTIAVGIFFLVEGVWGLTSPVVFGIFSTNLLHACIHCAFGVLLLYFGLKEYPSGILMFTGFVLFAVGVLWMVPASRDLVAHLLAVDRIVAVFNLILGAILWFVGASKPKRFS